jgi:hypothetical protein
MNQLKASIAQRCVQVAVLPLILDCYFSTLYHQPLSNKLLCLTASSYKVIFFPSSFSSSSAAAAA